MRTLVMLLALFAASSAMAGTPFNIMKAPGGEIGAGCRFGDCTVAKVLKISSTPLKNGEIKVEASLRFGSLSEGKGDKVDWAKDIEQRVAYCSTQKPRVVWLYDGKEDMVTDIPPADEIYEAIRGDAEFYYHACHSKSL